MLIRASDLDYQSTVPLYRQIADTLAQAIIDGRLPAGEALPTEEVLCRELQISRATVRRAYSELVEIKLVERQAGRGTFVKKRRLHRSTLASGFHEEMRVLGRKAESRLISCRQVVPTFDQLGNLGLKGPDPVWSIVRLDSADGTPVLVAHIVIPCALLPELDASTAECDLQAHLAQAIEDTGESIAYLHHAYGVCALPAEDAAFLGVNEGIPAFRIQRATVDTRGRIWEYSVRYEMGDATRFDVYQRPGSSILLSEPPTLCEMTGEQLEPPHRGFY